MEKTLAFYVTILRNNFKNYCSTRLQELGLTQGLFFFILYIGKHPDCSPKQLSDRLRMDAGHTNRTLTKLEASGFVYQEVNPKDRRAHLLKLTEKGENAFKVGHDFFTQWDNIVLECFSSTEKHELIHALNRLVKEGEQHVQYDFSSDNIRKCNTKK